MPAILRNSFSFLGFEASGCLGDQFGGWEWESTKRAVTDVIGPFKADWHVAETYIVGLDCFDDGEGD
jgi:hypothetical protein